MTPNLAQPKLAPAPELLDAHAAANLCSLSASTWWRRLAAGDIPGPIRIGRATRWRREELMGWIRAGCPARRTWEAMQPQQV